MWLLSTSLVPLLAMLAASDPKLTVEVDHSVVQVGVPFIISVHASGANVGEPTFPVISGLHIRSDIAVQSTQTSFQRGVIQQRKMRGFLATATRAGTITIPSITVQIDGQEVHSDPMTITASESPNPGRPAGKAESPTPPVGNPGPSDQAQNKEVTVDDLVLITTDVNKREVYQGEPVTLTLTMLRMQSPYDAVPNQLGVTLPTTQGFYAVPDKPKEAGSDFRVQNGFQYETQSWKQTLYPTVSGKLAIGPWLWQGVIAVHRSGPYTVTLKSEPIAVTVKPLPTPSPDAFHGAVGQFTLEAKLAKDSAMQGVPVELTVWVTGQGNPSGIGTPKLPTMNWAYVGDAEKKSAKNPPADGKTVEASFIFPLTPVQAGQQTIPPVEYCYFDPETQKYEIAKTPPLTLNVMPGTERDSHIVVGAGDSQANRINVLANDIIPNVTEPGTLSRQDSMVLVVPVLAGAPPLAFMALALTMRHRRRVASDSRYARAYHARSKLKKRIHAALDTAEPAAALYKAVTGFIADKLNVPESGMTSLDAKQLLESHGVDAEVSGALIKILRTCERAEYASTPLSEDELHAMVNGAMVNLDRFETQVKKRGAA